jgi:hypothetical protein
MLLLTGIVGSPAGVIGGRLFDRFGSYGRAFELNILICVIGILALAFAPMPQGGIAADTDSVSAAEPAV